MNTTFYKFGSSYSWAIALNFKLVRSRSVECYTGADADETVPGLSREIMSDKLLILLYAQTICNFVYRVQEESHIV